MELQIQQKDTKHQQIISEMQEHLQVLYSVIIIILALLNSLTDRLWKKIITQN